MRPQNLRLLLFLCLLPFSFCQLNCSLAPEVGRRIICLQIQQWDKDVRGTLKRIFAAVQGPDTIFDCMTLDCICSFMTGPCFGKSVRKEYRLLSDDERNRFHAAVWKLKQNGDYLMFSRIHSQFKTSPGAHSGPAFFPWHREFIKRMEIAIRRVDPLVPGLPFWDSVMDHGLPNSQDSILWGDELMGRNDADGIVRNGAFAGWRIDDNTRLFLRDLGNQSSLVSTGNLRDVFSFTTITDFLAFTAPQNNCPYPASWDAPEFVHGMPHVWTGGDMLVTRNSTNDPLFFLHHSFVDLMWETWRNMRQDRVSRETAYPADDESCSTAAHFAHSQMVPFPKENIDGLSNQYFDNLVSYAAAASCTFQNPDCASKFLFCDLSHGSPHCVAKARLGGNCNGFMNGENVCYNGICVGGVCQNGAIITTSSSSTTTRATTTTSSTANPPTTIARASCFNAHYCCEWWAATQQCTVNPSYMLMNCRASCGICQPQYDPSIECSDRSSMCSVFSVQMSCSSDWMAENCRNYCGWCRTTRMEQCTGGFSLLEVGSSSSTAASTSTSTTVRPSTTTTTTARPGMGTTSLSAISVVSCLNNHFCCLGWASLGYCSDAEFSLFMTQFCAPSCGQCGQKTLHSLWKDSSSCVDFLTDCDVRAAKGDCALHEVYMKENCKRTCRSCGILDMRRRLEECGLNRGRQRREELAM